MCQIRAAPKAAFPNQLGEKTPYVKWQFMPLMLLLFSCIHKLLNDHSHSEQCQCLQREVGKIEQRREALEMLEGTEKALTDFL